MRKPTGPVFGSPKTTARLGPFGFDGSIGANLSSLRLVSLYLPALGALALGVAVKSNLPSETTNRMHGSLPVH